MADTIFVMIMGIIVFVIIVGMVTSYFGDGDGE